MRFLVCHPGASFSTADVYEGLTSALERRGHDVQEYRLDWRVEEAHDFLKWQERRRKRADADYKTPEGGIMPEVIRRASMTLIEAVLTVNPHWLLVFSGMFLHPRTMFLLRRMGARSAILLTESPYDDAKQADVTPWFNLVFTNERASVQLLKRWHEQTGGRKGAANVEYMPHAYDPEKHRPDMNGTTVQPARIEDVVAPRHDVVFVGSGFIERQEMLQAVDWDGLGVDFGLYGHWPYVGSRNRLRRYLHEGTVPNAMTAALYRQAKLGLNLYRQSVGTSRNATRIRGAESLNPRALELAATGTPHISDWRPEVEEVFGELVPTFKNPLELETCIESYMINYDRDERARLGMLLHRSVRGWTFDARAEQLERALAAADVQP